MENLQVGFVILLLSFMVYVSFYDIERVGVDTGLIKNPAPIETAPIIEAEPLAPPQSEP
jgi:hypothetical protein